MTDDELRQLLESERDRAPLSDQHVDAAWSRFEKLAGAVTDQPAGDAGSAHAAPSPAAPARTALWLGTAGGLVVGAAIGVLVGRATVTSEPAPPRLSAVPVSIAPSAAADVEPPVPAPRGPASAEPTAPPAPPAVSARPVTKPRRTPTAQPTKPAAKSNLKAERVLLERARSALLRGDAKAALLAIDVHASRFPDGQLKEEREAMRAQAKRRR